MKLASFTIKTRIILTLLVLAVSMVAVGGLGLFGMKGVLSDLDRMYEARVLTVGDLADLQSSELQRQALLSLSVLADDPADVERVGGQLDEVEAQAATALKAFGEKQHTDEGRQTFQSALQAHDALRTSIEKVKQAVAASRLA